MGGLTVRERDESWNMQLSDCDVEEFLKLAAGFGDRKFGFAVTPNVDHVIRFSRDAGFREIYRHAAFVLFDSRFLARLLRLTNAAELPTCPGSDVTQGLFESVIGADDPIVLIGGSAQKAAILRERFGLRRLRHHNPPMGFIKDPAALEECARFIEDAAPFRFCFLAVGSPQQEVLAQLLLERGRARGLALCVGGAVNFLTGAERRAPKWMQTCGLEWSFRLAHNPLRLAQRYLIRGPMIFLMLHKLKFIVRDPVCDAPLTEFS